LASEELVKKLAETLLNGLEPLITPNTLSVEYAKHLRKVMPKLVEEELVKTISEVYSTARLSRPFFGELHREHLTLWTTRRRNNRYERHYVHIVIEGPKLLVHAFKLLAAYALGYTRRPLATLTIAYTTLRTILAQARGGNVYSGAGLLRRLRVLIDGEEWKPPTIIDVGVRQTANKIAEKLLAKIGAKQ